MSMCLRSRSPFDVEEAREKHTVQWQGVLILADVAPFSYFGKRVAGQQLASSYCEQAVTFLVVAASCIWPQPNPVCCCFVTVCVSWGFFPSQDTKPHHLSPAAPRWSVIHSSKAGCLHWPCVLLSLLGLPDCPLLGATLHQHRCRWPCGTC